MYGIEPRYNQPRYNEFFDKTNIIRKPKRKIYLDITNYNVNTPEKINADQQLTNAETLKEETATLTVDGLLYVVVA